MFSFYPHSDYVLKFPEVIYYCWDYSKLRGKCQKQAPAGRNQIIGIGSRTNKVNTVELLWPIYEQNILHQNRVFSDTQTKNIKYILISDKPPV